MIETVDDLKVALNVEDLRRMSSDKVLHLVKMVQKEGVNEAVLTALRSIAPDTMFQFAQAMDDSVQKAVASNDRSSDNLYAQIDTSKEILRQIIHNPNSSEQERQDALNRLERYDDKLFEHELNNKRFNLEVLKVNKEVVLGIGIAFGAVGMAAVSPEARKWLVQNGGKMVANVTRKALPGS